MTCISIRQFSVLCNKRRRGCTGSIVAVVIHSLPHIHCVLHISLQQLIMHCLSLPHNITLHRKKKTSKKAPLHCNLIPLSSTNEGIAVNLSGIVLTVIAVVYRGRRASARSNSRRIKPLRRYSARTPQILMVLVKNEADDEKITNQICHVAVWSGGRVFPL